MSLSEKNCIACDGEMPLLNESERQSLLGELDGWTIVGGKYLRKSFTLKNFGQALAMANKIGTLAEREGHHPDLLVAWGRLGVTIWTHVLDGLTENDFILAAKIDVLTKQPKKV